MKKICLLFFCLSQAQAQSPDWIMYKSGMSSSWYSTNCNNVTPYWVGNEYNYCKDSFSVKENYFAIASNYLSHLAFDDSGKLWIGSQSGLSSFDGQTWVHYNYANSGLTGNSVYSFVIDHNDIWMGSGGWMGFSGVVHYDGENWTVYDTSNSILEDNIIRRIAKDSLGNFWFGVGYSGAARFDGNTWTNFSEDNNPFPTNGAGDYLQAIVVDSSGIVWCATTVSGIFSYDGNSWTAYYPTADTNQIADMEYDREHNLLYVATFHGLYNYDGFTWSIWDSTNSGLHSNALYNLSVDRNNNLWVGYNYGGYSKYDGSTWTYYDSTNSAVGLDGVNDVIADANGNTWFATGADGFFKYDGVDYTHWNTYQQGFPTQVTPTCIVFEKNGHPWIGTILEGVMYFDGQNWSVLNSSNSLLPANNGISDLQIDTLGRLWIAMSSKGVACYNGNTWTLFNADNGALPNDGALSLDLDLNGNIWIAGQYFISKIDPQFNVTNFTSDNGLPTNYNWDVKCDADGNVWTTGYGEGLGKFDGTNWTIYNSGNTNLTNEYLRYLIIDNAGNKWCTTFGNELLKFDNNTWTEYDEPNTGVTGIGASEIAIRDNLIYLQLPGGMATFDGNNFSFYKRPPPLKEIIPWDHPMAFDPFGNLWVCTGASGIAEWMIGDSSLATSFTIRGEVYNDVNHNGVNDAGDLPLQNWKVMLLPDSISSFTNAQGDFYFTVDPGSFVVKSFPESAWQLSSGNDSLTVLVDSMNVSAIDFGYFATTQTTSAEVIFTSAHARCSSAVNHWINYINEGSTLLHGTINYDFDSLRTLSQSFYPTDSVVNNSLYFSFEDLAPFQNHQVFYQMMMPDYQFQGDTLSNFVIMSYADSSNQFFFTHDTSHYVIYCDYDPNEMIVNPTGVESQHFTLMADTLTYTINFQNTGNDTAYNVSVRDSLCAFLDLSSFAVLASSHSVNTFLKDDGTILFEFQNIMLPDSNANEAFSHGFVKYRILPKQGTPDYSLCTNRASIYFGLNPPVLTNEVFNILVHEIHVSLENVLPNATQINLYPNPTEGKVTFEINMSSKLSSSNEIQIVITNLIGQDCFFVTEKCLSPKFIKKVDLSEFPSGTYFLKIKSRYIEEVVKLVKE